MLENYLQLTAEQQHLTETFGRMGDITMTTKSKRSTPIESTLKERGANYGEFSSHAMITQEIKRALDCTGKFQSLSDDQKEALEMVAHKIGRIINGDPNYKDSWVDIEGYVHLVSQTLAEPVT